jgi:2',3'-cyclic-nucleotide 2'-phosphodiesterase (5'-nucleotidase family)
VVARSSVDLIIYDPAAASEGRKVRVIRNTETNLGDLIADAYLDQSGDADLAVINGGGIRAQLNRGELTMDDIMTVAPYNNALTVIEATGQQILDAMEWSVHSLPDEFGGFLHVANMTYEVDPTLPTPCMTNESLVFDHVDDSMERRVRNVRIKGEPLDPAKTYKLASVNVILLNEGDGYTMFRDCSVLQRCSKLDNQVIMDYLSKTLGGHIGKEYEEPYGQGRMVSVAPQE